MTSAHDRRTRSPKPSRYRQLNPNPAPCTPPYMYFIQLVTLSHAPHSGRSLLGETVRRGPSADRQRGLCCWEISDEDNHSCILYLKMEYRSVENTIIQESGRAAESSAEIRKRQLSVKAEQRARALCSESLCLLHLHLAILQSDTTGPVNNILLNARASGAASLSLRRKLR